MYIKLEWDYLTNLSPTLDEDNILAKTLWYYDIARANLGERSPQDSIHNFNASPTDVRLSFDECPIIWEDMATSEREGSESDLKDNSAESGVNEKQDEKTDDHEIKHAGHCQNYCLRALFVILGIVGGVASVSLISLAILTSIATKAYDAEQSSRIANMVFISVLAAITICTIIYGEVAVFKRHSKSVNVAAVVLLLLAVVQALIAGIAVNVEPDDEAKLLKSLIESFKLAREENSRHVKMWAMTQSDLNCCGVYGPEDYRHSKIPYYFPPNVPISCCPTYDSSRSDLVQEKDRELCKVKKSYYTDGCKDLVLSVFKETSSMVFAVAVLLIVVEVLLMITGAFLYRRETKMSIK
ncbi:hypothetical protein HW555_006200 [Spodoptera exigua]|uniref:Tetraspanin n=1 Tax=Spodoptera exigua TaxID=7107 RepID=A0A835LAA4_SPOEX|nr:hypothetical protein HW555_006200 [Spodoptera exigua]